MCDTNTIFSTKQIIENSLSLFDASLERYSTEGKAQHPLIITARTTLQYHKQDILLQPNQRKQIKIHSFSEKLTITNLFF